jgi:hypothetical protein
VNHELVQEPISCTCSRSFMCSSCCCCCWSCSFCCAFCWCYGSSCSFAPSLDSPAPAPSLVASTSHMLRYYDVRWSVSWLLRPFHSFISSLILSFLTSQKHTRWCI